MTEIQADQEVNFRDAIDQERVSLYREAVGDLPPMVVIEIEGELTLADGFHRHAAMVAEGLEEITVDVRPGTRNEAMRIAAVANAQHGNPLTRTERDKAIVWLADQEFPYEDIGRHFALSKSRVSEIATAGGIRRRDESVAAKAQDTRRKAQSGNRTADTVGAKAETGEPAPAGPADSVETSPPVSPPPAAPTAVATNPTAVVPPPPMPSTERVVASAAPEETAPEASAYIAPETVRDAILVAVARWESRNREQWDLFLGRVDASVVDIAMESLRASKALRERVREPSAV